MAFPSPQLVTGRRHDNLAENPGLLDHSGLRCHQNGSKFVDQKKVKQRLEIVYRSDATFRVHNLFSCSERNEIIPFFFPALENFFFFVLKSPNCVFHEVISISYFLF